MWNKIKNKVYLPFMLALAGCPYTNEDTVLINDEVVELDGKLDSVCLQEIEDQFGKIVTEATPCLLEIIAESVGDQMPEETYFTIAHPGDDGWNNQNDGTCTEIDGVTYIAVMENSLTTVLESAFHEIGHTPNEPKDSVFGNHLNAEFYTTYFSFNLVKVLSETSEVYAYDFSPKLGFYALCPMRANPPNIEDLDFIDASAVCDMDKGAYARNKDFVPAQLSILSLIQKYDGNLEAVRDHIQNTTYPAEYLPLYSKYQDRCDNKKLYPEFKNERVLAREAIDQHVKEQMPNLAQFWEDYNIQYGEIEK
ncbi:MAG: hypothetical protein ABIF40_04395 [archaeon]